MINLSKLTDPYERKARVYPALICLLPPFLALSIAYPQIYTTFYGIAVAASSIGGIQFLSQLARDAGKRLEPDLFGGWGGMPSVAILRHRDERLPAPAKRRYHERLAELTAISAPSSPEETGDPNAADEIYRSWSDYMRSRTRNTKKYPLVFLENTNYGFRRNLFGLKWWCLTCGIAAIVVSASPSVYTRSFSQTQLATCAAFALYTLTILVVVRRKWVKLVADEYAKQLIEAINA